MVNLIFTGLSADGTFLHLADSRGKQYSVALDARLRALLRGGDTAPGQLEIALNTLGPREIQARLRAGATVAELADEANIDVERIERYAGPPLAEREYHAMQARDVHLPSHLGDRSLLVVVGSAAERDSVPVDLIRWDAWLREDGTWQVLTAYPVGGVDRVAAWIYDHRDRWVRADGLEAENMVAGPQAPAKLESVSPKKGQAATEAAPNSAPAQANSSSGSAGAPADETAALPSEPTPDQAPADPAAARGTRKSKRASVPTWDEILFGGGTAEDTTS